MLGREGVALDGCMPSDETWKTVKEDSTGNIGYAQREYRQLPAGGEKKNGDRQEQQLTLFRELRPLPLLGG